MRCQSIQPPQWCGISFLHGLTFFPFPGLSRGEYWAPPPVLMTMPGHGWWCLPAMLSLVASHRRPELLVSLGQ